MLWALLMAISGRLALLPALADGCFVFRWNKDIDIKEPTQKAIIVYDAGREDLLLRGQIRGALEEFGWLIPVPSLPTVEKGFMQPFYELSQLTQKQSGEGLIGYTRRDHTGRSGRGCEGDRNQDRRGLRSSHSFRAKCGQPGPLAQGP